MDDPELVSQLAALMAELEDDPETRVVVFDSADPDYFIAHVDLVKADQFDLTPQPATGLPAWPDLAIRLERAPFVTVSAIPGAGPRRRQRVRTGHRHQVRQP